MLLTFLFNQYFFIIKIMVLKYILLGWVLLLLYGCQQEVSAPTTSATAKSMASVQHPVSEVIISASDPLATPNPLDTRVLISVAEAMELAKQNNCLSCHAIDKKLVGPAWKAVAARYRGDSTAEDRLMHKIADGGSGVWGVMVMTPSPQIIDADRRKLARFVLSLQ
jgi:cytochrome c